MEDSRLDSLHDKTIRPFDLLICAWVCHRGEGKGDAIVVTESEKRLVGELSAIVCDDAIGDAKSEDNVLNELSGPLHVDYGDRIILNPLGELFNKCHFEGADYV